MADEPDDPFTSEPSRLLVCRNAGRRLSRNDLIEWAPKDRRVPMSMEHRDWQWRVITLAGTARITDKSDDGP